MTTLAAWLATVGPDWLYHPLGQCSGRPAEVQRCLSYNFWSGIEGNVALLSWLAAMAVAGWRLHRHLECHVEAPRNCHRWGHPVPGTGHRACRRHHPHAQERGTGVTAQDILRHHEQSGA